MINSQALRDKLRNLAKERNVPFNYCWKQLLLERFLLRLSLSPYTNKLIFKGGSLLAYMMKIGRETMDIDFLISKIKAEKNFVIKVFNEICSIPSIDGFVFSFANIEFLSQPHMIDPGFRITLDAKFHNMKDKIHIDLGIGDEVDPENMEIKLSEYKGTALFEETISLLVYPIESIFAEKLQTILQKGSLNSRMKDFHDLYLICLSHQFERLKLSKAIEMTFSNRHTTLSKVHFNEEGLHNLQKYWNGHIKGLGKMANELELPKSIGKIIEEINKIIEGLA